MTLPHVVLHDHLDGGLRPETVLDLADQIGHRLPADNREDLAAWFDQSTSGSLETYLAAFEHTLAVMQTEEALRRVAVECMEDLTAGGAVHIESRFAPLLSTVGGLRPEAVMEAVLDGMRSGAEANGASWGMIVDAIRSEPGSEEAAHLAIRYADQGVVAFDLAGPEAGFPPDDHLAAIRAIREHGLGLTLHAGEAGGVASIALAVNRCGTDRIGHGVEIIDDVVDGTDALGRVATVVRDRRIPLEICPMSNLATKGWSPEQHPLARLHRLGFSVTISTDNRLMSATSMAREFEFARAAGLDIYDLAVINHRALEAAFCPEPVRRKIWEETMAPAYASAGAEINPRW